MKVIDYPIQAKQPKADNEDELVKFDIEYFVECLAKMRNSTFEIVDRPDTKNRNSPQPDYLIRNKNTGDLVAIEHARFFESEKTRKKEASRVKKDGIYYGLINFPTPEELGKRLFEFFNEKADKGQFSSFKDCERIIIARSRWSGLRIKHFLKANHYFNYQACNYCDHFYLIVEHQLLEIF